MASDTKQIRDHDYLRIVIDDGSGRLKVAGQHVPTGKTPSELAVDFVHVQPGYSTLDQKFLIIKGSNGHDQLLQGDDEVTNWVNDNPTHKHRVIDSHKLVLFDEYKDLPASCGFFKSIESRHGDMANVQAFTALRYKTIRDGILSFYKDHTAKGLGRDSNYWENISIEVMITVPALWGAQACSILKNAATDAGFSSINLRLEPLCAAALNMQTLFKEGRVQDGVVLAFCDTGHLTNDRAAVKYTIDADHSEHLEIIGKPHGDAYGSHYINHLACQHVRSCAEVAEHGGLEEVLRRLGGLPVEAFDRQVSNEIDFRKKEHPRDFVISVTGMDAHRQIDQGIDRIYIRITRHQMQHFLDTWTARVVELDKQWLSSPMFHNEAGSIIRGLVITGGGGRDRTLQRARTQELRELVNNVYHDHADRDHEVAEGGMRRYPINLTSQLQYGHFYIERGQPGRVKARKSAARTKASKRKQRGGASSLNCSGPTSCDIESARCVPKAYLIMKRMPNEKLVTKCIPMRFEVDQEFNVSLEFFLYHSPSFFPNGVVLHDQDGKLRNEFNLLDVPFAFPDVKWEQYEDRVEMYERDGGLWYDVFGLVRMEARETLQYDNFGNIKTNANYRTVAEVKREIWDAARTSHIPDDMRPVATQTAAPDSSNRTSAPKRPSPRQKATANRYLTGSQSKGTRSAADSMRKRKAAEMLRAFDSDCDDEELLPLPPPKVDEEKHADDDEIIVSPRRPARDESGRFISKTGRMPPRRL